MALSCSMLPWEPCCLPHSALRTPPHPPSCFTEVRRGRRGGKKGVSVLYSVVMSERWWETVIMQSWLFSLSAGDIVSSGWSYSLKLWNMTQSLVCVYMCVCLRVCIFALGPSQQIWSFCSHDNSHSLLGLTGHICSWFFVLLDGVAYFLT